MNKHTRSQCVFVLVLLSFLFTAAGHAATKLVTFDTPEQELLYEALLEEYRCLKCQNQNLAGSNADLAGDLRREIRDQVMAGKSREEIDTYLVARYGDFVLYRPRLKASTLILWFGPFVLLLAAGVFAVRVAEDHSAFGDETSPDINSKDVDKARALLDE